MNRTSETSSAQEWLTSAGRIGDQERDARPSAKRIWSDASSTTNISGINHRRRTEQRAFF
jgi:hypothetical protein